MYSLFFQSKIPGGIERRMYHFFIRGKGGGEEDGDRDSDIDWKILILDLIDGSDRTGSRGRRGHDG